MTKFKQVFKKVNLKYIIDDQSPVVHVTMYIDHEEDLNLISHFV